MIVWHADVRGGGSAHERLDLEGPARVLGWQAPAAAPGCDFRLELHDGRVQSMTRVDGRAGGAALARAHHPLA